MYVLSKSYQIRRIKVKISMDHSNAMLMVETSNVVPLVVGFCIVLLFCNLIPGDLSNFERAGFFTFVL